jgi:hypothetical protein
MKITATIDGEGFITIFVDDHEVMWTDNVLKAFVYLLDQAPDAVGKGTGIRQFEFDLVKNPTEERGIEW